ncbi:type II secretion system protein N [Parasphingorhabdus sp.]|uniref:type II secretion system protein N n=1 Tax=Parasphingorhabdus sp. TaxID=2709688 RepID=UPI0039C9F074
MDNQVSNQFLVKGRLFPKPGLYTIILVILAILLVVQAVRLVWLVVTPVGPVGEWSASQVQVLPPQSRAALLSSFDPFYRSSPEQSANVITSLQLTLYGVRMNEGSGLGSAILAGPDGVQQSYAVGEEVMPGVTLDAVHFDHVVIDRGGARESLYLDQSVPAETVGDDMGGAVDDEIFDEDETLDDIDPETGAQ